MKKSLNYLLNSVADMEKKETSVMLKSGEFNGITKEGKEIKVKYRYGLKIGLDDLIKRKKHGPR